MNLINIILWPLEKYARLCGWKKDDFDYEDYLVDDPIDYDRGVEVLRNAPDIPCDDGVWGTSGNPHSSNTVTQPYIKYEFHMSPDIKLEQVREKLDTLYLTLMRNGRITSAADVQKIIDFIDK